MLEVHAGLLWLGHALDIREPTGLFDAGIRAVVDVAYEEPPAILPRQLIYFRIPLNDGGGNAPQRLRLAIDTVSNLLHLGTPTIVACSAGMSRSPTVAAFALSRHTAIDPQNVLKQFAEKKSLEINPILWRDFENHAQ